MDLKEIENGINPGDHWYFRAKRKLLLNQVPLGCTQSVDVGAGSKFFSYELAGIKTMHQVFPIDPNFDTETIETIGNCKVVSLKEQSEKTQNSQFWVFMDVIEHVEDDLRFLKDYVNCAPKGSRFFITVPAYAFMWSNHDVFLGHFRRYTTKSLKLLVHNAGLTTLSIGYFYSFLFPLAFIQRKILSRMMRSESDSSGLSKQSYLINRIFELILNAELRITKGFGKLPGLTVTCSAEKS
jgi:hypothetical protein